MVLNDREPCDTESTDDEELSWEMVVDADEEQRPPSSSPGPTGVPLTLPAAERSIAAAAAAAAAAADDDDDEDAAGGNDASIGVTISDGDTFVSGVSSITGEHHSVSDVEDGEDDDDDDEGGEATNDERRSLDDDRPSESTAEERDRDRAGEEETEVPPPTDDPLLDQLSEMGFDAERIVRAIADLRDAGATTIDADSIIGSMTGEGAYSAAAAAAATTTTTTTTDRHPLEPLLGAWELVGRSSTAFARDWDERGRAIGRTAREAWTSVADESHRLVRRLVRDDCDDEDDDIDRYDDADRDVGRMRSSADRYSAATAQMRHVAASAKDTIRRANEEYRIAEKVVAVAVVGSAAMLALGNPRASIGAMAVAGAGLAAGEAMRQHSSEQQHAACRGGASRRDYGLRCGLHLD